jgi:hypothetical protein
MGLPAAIGELPFVERPLFELLGFADDRMEIDEDYAGFGWALADALWLDGGGELRCVVRPLVLALHSADAVGPAGDLLLEFDLGDAGAIAAPLAAFLEIWLPRLPREHAIVLALCNPRGLTVLAPAAATRPLFYGVGDVDSWLDPDPPLPRDAEAGLPALSPSPLSAPAMSPDRSRYRLTAQAWRRAQPTPGVSRLHQDERA